MGNYYNIKARKNHQTLSVDDGAYCLLSQKSGAPCVFFSCLAPLKTVYLFSSFHYFITIIDGTSTFYQPSSVLISSSVIYTQFPSTRNDFIHPVSLLSFLLSPYFSPFAFLLFPIYSTLLTHIIVSLIMYTLSTQFGIIPSTLFHQYLPFSTSLRFSFPFLSLPKYPCGNSPAFHHHSYYLFLYPYHIKHQNVIYSLTFLLSVLRFFSPCGNSFASLFTINKDGQ